MTLNKAPILIILLLSFTSLIYAQDFSDKPPQDITISPPQTEFRAGETLVYSVEWLGIPVGKIILKVEEPAVINNKECYHITAQAMPNRFFQRLYDLEYKVDSYIDKKTFLPVRFEKVRRLKKESNFVTIDFDHKKNEATYKCWGSAAFIKLSPKRQKLEAVNPVTTSIPKGTQDLFSSFYYFRVLEIEAGQSYPVNIYYNQRNWPVKMKVDKPFLREMRRRGAFAVVKVFPVSELNDYVLGKRNFSVYLTVDSRRTPLEFRLNSAMGPIRGTIQDPIQN